MASATKDTRVLDGYNYLVEAWMEQVELLNDELQGYRQLVQSEAQMRSLMLDVIAMTSGSHGVHSEYVDQDYLASSGLIRRYDIYVHNNRQPHIIEIKATRVTRSVLREQLSKYFADGCKVSIIADSFQDGCQDIIDELLPGASLVTISEWLDTKERQMYRKYTKRQITANGNKLLSDFNQIAAKLKTEFN